MAKSYNWTFAADGNGASQSFDFSFSNAQFVAFGTFGSGTVKLQFSPDYKGSDATATWIDTAGISLTANGSKGFRESFGNRIRPVLSGSTNPTLTVRVMDQLY